MGIIRLPNSIFSQPVAVRDLSSPDSRPGAQEIPSLADVRYDLAHALVPGLVTDLGSGGFVKTRDSHHLTI